MVHAWLRSGMSLASMVARNILKAFSSTGGVKSRNLAFFTTGDPLTSEL